jgi:hypothetical protein
MLPAPRWLSRLPASSGPCAFRDAELWARYSGNSGARI